MRPKQLKLFVIWGEMNHGFPTIRTMKQSFQVFAFVCEPKPRHAVPVSSESLFTNKFQEL